MNLRQIPFQFIILLALFFPMLVAHGEERVWTSSDGNKIKGEIVSLEGDQILLKTAKGNFKFPLSRLSKVDQDYAKGWKEKAVPGTPGGGKASDKTVGAGIENVKLGEWPKFIAADFELDQIQVVKEDKAAGEYIYPSPHFEFRSPQRLSKSVIREFARLFEATFEFARLMPIGLDPQPWGEGYYPTQLYMSRDDYYQDGGMQGSGGMYSYAWRGKEIVKSIIKVPLPNLGVEYTGTRFIVDHKKRSDTLIHEIAHQMTGRWSILTPTWFREGLAETISCQRFNNGRFTLTSMDRAVKEDVVKRSRNEREFEMLNLERLMTITGSEWAADLASPLGGSKNYPSANLLFFYYLRLEGEGKGENLVKYMKALSEGMKEDEARVEVLMGGKSYEEVQKDIAEKWRSEGLRLSFN